jgi:hypothetical protein
MCRQIVAHFHDNPAGGSRTDGQTFQNLLSRSSQLFCEPPNINCTASECLWFELTAGCAHTLICGMMPVYIHYRAACAHTLMCCLQSVHIHYRAACSLCTYTAVLPAVCARTIVLPAVCAHTTMQPAICAHTLLCCLQSVHIHYRAACSLCAYTTVLPVLCAHAILRCLQSAHTLQRDKYGVVTNVQPNRATMH